MPGIDNAHFQIRHFQVYRPHQVANLMNLLLNLCKYIWCLNKDVRVYPLSTLNGRNYGQGF